MRAAILALLGVGIPFVECTKDEQTQNVSVYPTRDERLQRCSVEDLLPGLGDKFQSRWTPLAENETRPHEYDCTCRYSRARYFRPSRRLDYPSWVPRAVAEKKCAGHEILEGNPFPPGKKILFYGNSHLRQVVESIMCRYADDIVRREVLLVEGDNFKDETVHSVSLDRQCRGHMLFSSETMIDSGCLSAEEAEEAVRCSDDRSVFDFANGATAHYCFVHHEGKKSMERAFRMFGTTAKDYDIVVANPGNSPTIPIPRVIAAAREFQKAGVSFLWLSTYDGQGNIQHWSSDQRRAFADANGKYLAVHDIMSGVGDFTVGAIEHSDDEHFCLPGPPTELGMLVLQLIWALDDEKSRL